MLKPRSNWQWMRVYYYDRCKDRLLLDAIGPATALAQQECPDFRFYFLRDWFRGPNVLVGTLARDNLRTTQILTQQIAAYLRLFPSSENFSEAEYMAMNERLSRWEARANDDQQTLQLNNQVLDDQAEPLSPFLVDPHLKDVCRSFLAASSTQVLRWLALCSDGDLERDTVALTLMITLVWLADAEHLRPYTSFTSHAAGFLGAADADGTLGQTYDALYNGPHGASIRELIACTVAHLEADTGAFPGLQASSVLLRSTLLSIFSGLKKQELHPVDASSFFVGQTMTSKSINMIETLNGCCEWRAWQIAISLLYQVLNQLGISPAKRFLACYLLGRGIEDVYGQRHDDILAIIHQRPAAVFTFAEGVAQ
jgi:hypothetical protein